MNNQQLVSFIQDNLKNGFSKDQIKNHLLQNSWQENQIQEAFNFVESLTVLTASNTEMQVASGQYQQGNISQPTVNMKTTNMKKINKIILSTLLILNTFNFVGAQSVLSEERKVEIRKIVDTYQVRFDLTKDLPISDYINNFKPQDCSENDLTLFNANISKYIKSIRVGPFSFGIECSKSDSKTYLAQARDIQNLKNSLAKITSLYEQDIISGKSSVESINKGFKKDGIYFFQIESSNGAFIYKYEGKEYPGNIAIEKYMARVNIMQNNIVDSKYLDLKESDFFPDGINIKTSVGVSINNNNLEVSIPPQTCTLPNYLKKPLKKGSRGDSVKQVQRYLYDKGYLKVNPNGNYGPSTVAAVKQYQTNSNLIVTGVVGNVSLEQMRLDCVSNTSTSVNTNLINIKLETDKYKAKMEVVSTKKLETSAEIAPNSPTSSSEAILKNSINNFKSSLKSKEDYITYLKSIKNYPNENSVNCKSREGLVRGEIKTSSFANGYGYTVLSTEKIKCNFSFFKIVNGENLSISINEYIDFKYEEALKQRL